MDQEKYIVTGTLETILQAIPDSIAGNSVVIKIERISDGYTWNFTTLAFASGANTGTMTNVSGSVWKATFTPATNDSYVVTITDPNRVENFFYKYYQSSGSAPTTPTAPSAGDLTTYAKVKAELGLADDTDQAYINTLITMVSAVISDYCNRTFEDAAYTEYHNGNWNKTLNLKQYPVNSITSIHDDVGLEYGSDTLIDSDDYATDMAAGIVELLSSVFAKGVKNIKVVYNAGYTTIPSGLEYWAVKLVAKAYSTRGKDGIDSEKIGTYSVTYSKEDIPAEIKRGLDKYKKIR